MFKKCLSVVLVLVMIVSFFTVLPLSASAQAAEDGETTAELTNNDLSVTGANSFGSMLSEAIEGEEQLDDDNTGNNIFSVEVTGDTAYVELETTVDAVVLVGIYREEDNSMRASGTAHITPADTVVEVTLNTVSMPEYFIVRAFLVDEEKNAPLCKSCESMLYTREMQDFLQKTTDDFDENSVLNLDDSDDNNFAVYSDDATLIESTDDSTNKVALADDASRTYVIENADENFTSLQPGEIVSYSYGEENLLIVKVKTIDVTGTTVTITGDEIELDDVFDYIKIDNTMGVDKEKYDPSTCEEGVTFTGYGDDIAPTGSDGSKSDLAATGVEGSVGGSTTLNFDILKKDDNDDDPGDNVGTSGSQGVKFSAGLEFKIGVTLKYYVSVTYVYLEYKSDISVKTFGKAEGSFNREIGLGVVPIGPFWGLTLELRPSLVFEAKASIEVSATIKGSLGFSVSGTSGLQNLSSTPKATLSTKVEGSVFCGVKIAAALCFLKKVAKAELSGTLGFEAAAESDWDDYSALNVDIEGSAVSDTDDVTAKVAGPNEPDTTHDCRTCFKGELCAKLMLGVKATLLDIPKLTYSKNFLTLKVKLKDFHYSLDFNEFGWCRCPHKRNKVSLTVFNGDKTAAGFTTVACSYIDKDNRAYKCLETQTDSKGRLALMLSAGKYKLTFTRSGNKTLTKEIEVVDTTQDIKLTLKNDDNKIRYTLKDGVLTVYGTGKIGDKSFYNRTFSDSIKKVIIKKGVTGIGKLAFAYCYYLMSVTIPDSVTSIGSDAFWGCTSLTSVSLSDGLTSIGSKAFYACSSLTSITLPDSLTSIGQYAFNYCRQLTSVTIPNNMTSIGEGAFSECYSLTNIDVHPDNPKYASLNGNLYNKDLTEIIRYAIGKKDVSFTIPDSVISIGGLAFCESTSLTSVTIPDSVTSIGYFAFSSCDSLSSITIPDSVTSIGGHAFQYCKSLTGVTIPDGVTSIEEYVFYDCKSLTSVTIPDTVTFIGLMAFCGCNSLMSITIPDSVTIIGCDAFCGCTSLTNVTIPDSVTSIKSYTFEYCSSLTSITIPVSVTSIGYEVFRYCNSLSDIYYQGSESEWNAISIGNYAIPSSVVIHYNSSGIAGTGAQPEYPMHSAPDLAPIGDETEGPAEQTERSAEQSESSGFTRSGLIPGSEAILIVAGDNGSAVDIDSNLLYIAQTAANENGTATFCVDPALLEDDYITAIFGWCAHVNCAPTTFNEGTDDETELYYCNDCHEIINTEVPPEPTEPHTVVILGDVDFDGNIEIRDATWIQRHAADIDIPFTISKTTADIDGDGEITVMDATAIQYYLCHLKTPYPIGETIS